MSPSSKHNRRGLLLESVYHVHAVGRGEAVAVEVPHTVVVFAETRTLKRERIVVVPIDGVVGWQHLKACKGCV